MLSEVLWAPSLPHENSVLMKLLMGPGGGEGGAVDLCSGPQLFLLTLVLSSLTKGKRHKDPSQPSFLGS